MLTLYAVPHSLYCAKTRILLRAKGIGWAEQTPAQDRAAFDAASPFGNLPAIRHGDFTLSDSEAIAEYLEEAFPAPALLPKGLEARAQARMRGRFHDTRLEPAVRALFPLVTSRDALAAARAGSVIQTRLAQLAALLGQGRAFDLGDCGYGPTFLWLDLLVKDLGLALDWPEPVQAYRAWLGAVPSVAAELAAYAPHAQEWMDEKQAARGA